MPTSDVQGAAPATTDHPTEPGVQTYRAAVVREFMTPMTIEQVPRRKLETGHALVEPRRVFGVGGLGHLAIQYAAIAGGRVVAV